MMVSMLISQEYIHLLFDLLRHGFFGRISGVCQYLCCNRSDAEYRYSAAVCELRPDITMVIVYWNGVCIERWFTTEKILGGINP